MIDKIPPLTFPCRFPIKAMGKNTPEFQAKVLAIMRQYVPDLGEGAVTHRLSKDSHFLALTIEITATSQEQLDQIYQALSDCDEVLVAL